MEPKEKRIPYSMLPISRVEHLIAENDHQLRSAIFLKKRDEKLDKNQLQQLFLLHPLFSKNMNMVDVDKYARILYEEERSVAEFV